MSENPAMSENSGSATFEQVAEVDPDAPTLIEGLPGHGLVAAIAVDQITSQLDLSHYGNIYADAFPPVVTFENGLVHDLVRVYAGSDPAVMTLESDLALPPAAFEPLSRCVMDDLAIRFDRAVFIAGAPASSEAQLGEVIGVATNDEIKSELIDAGITIAEDHGIVGGVTGALVRQCYHADVPAALLVVHSHPFLPDPKAARDLIETALEPLVDFDIDTSELDEQSETIKQQMQQVAEQYQQMFEEPQADHPPAAGMFQ